MNPLSTVWPGKPQGIGLSQWCRQLVLLGLAVFTLAPPLARASDKVPPAVARQAAPFDLQQVRLLDGPFREAMLRDKAYLLSLDPDRLLHTFRVNAGLPSSAQPYGGWEEPKCELRGHSVGHYLSACALMYASTGEEALKQRANLLVAELAKCQAAAPQQGFHPGYLSAFPESFIDRVEARQSVWAPWYTLHKIYAGLLDTYQLCGNPQALEVLARAADWIQYRVDHLSEAQMQKSLDTEFGGMNEVLANLYAVTGNPQHLRLARAFDHQRLFEPLAQREDRLDGLHANTQIPKMIGAAREYELTGETRYRDIAEYFWQRVAQRRSYVIGGHSDGEHFFPVTDFAKHLSPATTETCNTYNMLKLTRHLFGWEPNAQLMDFYERALYN
ncbi:MAG TPA: beta-L-arabinofuranosidase domain-containing protein, partial [Bacillota bacterium]|nr:beta-L-arabinofuranosidase domain-containing protein [Bacillota bacterium]